MRAPNYTIYALALLLFGQLYGQNSSINSSDCQQAIPICADSNVTSMLDGPGDVHEFEDAQGEFPDFVGCLQKGRLDAARNIENHSGWYVFRAGTSGLLGFDIIQTTENDEAGIDFALFGPFDDVLNDFCSNVGLEGIQPIRCNYEENELIQIDNTTTYGFTGLRQGGEPYLDVLDDSFSSSPFGPLLDVQEGEVYYLFLNSYSNTQDANPTPEFEIEFTGNIVDANPNTALDCSIRDLFLGPDIVACVGQPDIILSASSAPLGVGIDTIRWSADLTDDGIENPVAIPSALGMEELTIEALFENSGTYYVEVVPLMGDNVNDSVVVTINDEPNINDINVVIIDDLLRGMNDHLYTIEVNYLRDDLINDNDYEFSIDNGNSFQDGNVFTNVAAGNYIDENDLLYGIMRDKYCGFELRFPIDVVGYPKFFTPNGDGTNDIWHIRGIEQLTNPVVFIFDRFGKLIKQLPGTEGWDGTYIGRPMPSSDYWFSLEYERDGQRKVVRSHFTLKR